MINVEHIEDWRGKDVVDPEGATLGKLQEVYYDKGTQTPILLANKRDRSGHASRNAVRLVISKELPANFRLPGKQALNEQVFYMLLQTFLKALTEIGVAVCGVGSVEPLAGHTESIGPRN